jgi:methionine sulfoxide reductase heme-binding subunit
MRILFYIAALLPFLYMGFIYILGLPWQWPHVVSNFFANYLHFHFGARPHHINRFLQDFSGETALYFFMVTLALRPVHDFLKINLLGWRRALGLWGFFYLLLHFLVFAGIKHHFEMHKIFAVIGSHPFLIFGAVAFVIFVLLTITSIPALFVKLHSWHKLFYVAMVLVIVHILLGARHIDLADIVSVAVIAALLALRLVKHA